MLVTVVPYDPSWEGEYEKEAQAIKEILDGILIDVHHIGSTSVRGLCAKPIIDIMPVVTDIDQVDLFNERFEELGYECMGEFGIAGRRYFRKGGDARTHQVHIFQKDNSWDVKRHLAVRDYLRTHADVAKEYGDLKLELADLFPDDIVKYCEGKDSFVKELEKNALVWQELQGK